MNALSLVGRLFYVSEMDGSWRLAALQEQLKQKIVRACLAGTGLINTSPLSTLVDLLIERDPLLSLAF